MIIITISIAITIIIIISNTIYHYYYDHCYSIIVTIIIIIIINKSSKLIHTRLLKPSQREVIQAYPLEVNHKQGIQADSHRVIQAYLHEARLIHTMLSNLIHMRLPTNKWSKLIYTRLFKLPKPLHKQAAQAYPHEIIRTKPDREKTAAHAWTNSLFNPGISVRSIARNGTRNSQIKSRWRDVNQKPNEREQTWRRKRKKKERKWNERRTTWITEVALYIFQKKEKEIETRSYALKYAKHCEKERQRIRKKGTCALKYAIYFAISVLSLAFLTAY